MRRLAAMAEKTTHTTRRATSNGHKPSTAKKAAGSRRAHRPAAPAAEPEIPIFTAEAPQDSDQPDPALRQELIGNLESMINRLRALSPGYNPPPFSPRQLLELNVDKLPPELGLGILTKLRKSIGEDLFDVDTWKGIWTMLNYTLEYQGDVLKRRVTGDYTTDEWGFDREYFGAVLPFLQFMFDKYWRVEMTGVENIPAAGRALLVSNHSGQLPFDGAMLSAGVMLKHPNQRLVRSLYATWFPTLPFISDFLAKCGGVLATDENGARLLQQDELVAVYPEGYKGVSKLYKERYRLARFGRGGFVRMALKTGAPMLPVAVVGAEETYMSLGKSDLLSRLTGFPYFPITPTFPWLGLLGVIPMPTKWYIDIGEPIPLDGYDASAANNVMAVSQLTDQVRNVVQKMLYARLKQRRSVFAA